MVPERCRRTERLRTERCRSVTTTLKFKSESTLASRTYTTLGQAYLRR